MKTKTDWNLVQREESTKVHRRQISEMESKLKAYGDALAIAKKERDAALAISGTKIKVHKVVASSESETEATAFALASDWHAEETVDGKTVNGLNEFNLEIAEQRIDRFFRSVIKLTEIERAGTSINTLVIPFLGDLMTGYIHEELQESNGLSPTQTVLWLRERIVGGLKYIIRNGGFTRIIAPCTVGNHGRTTKKMRHATSTANSYEWMLYQVLKTDLPEIEWMIADGYFQFLEVYGRNFRMHHGDNVQYQGGIGGLTIPMEKAIASWNKSQPVYMDLIGHHHTFQQSTRWMCNGPLIGYGPYALSIKAGFEAPSQTYFLVDSKRGRTGTWPIFL